MRREDSVRSEPARIWGKGMQNRMKGLYKEAGWFWSRFVCVVFVACASGVCIFHSQRKELRFPCCYKADIIMW